ncbi:uncharacterized protein LOC113500818 [Trichoplusia ni]|uniref:Uncharacterized protein LOC113500818 n=1 Tax=Trichoplusia ni TaxID=7111 RepID=A0A7E5WA42_TRINI|nr:uncharacterized protein LOC113500818 [Trichoplusia ni]
MKTTSVIRFAALAAVLLASTNVDAYCSASSKRMDWSAVAGMVDCEKILCVINLVTSGEFTMTGVMKCITGFGRFEENRIATFAMFQSELHSVTFDIKNDNNVGGKGKIMNSALSSGQWVRDDQKVYTVNNIVFNQIKSAEFKAVSTDEENSEGVKGSFEIHLDGSGIAEVSFELPYFGPNTIEISPINKRYVCKVTGWQASGSPEASIVCYKIGTN